MINSKSVLAVIPARGGSKGLPLKNIRKMCGKPLIAWSIEKARESKFIDEIIVTTDSREIADIAEQFGASVPFLRPDTLSGDKATSIDVLLHAINYMSEIGADYDYVVLLEPTSPLRDVSDIDGAIAALEKNQHAKSIVGVVEAEASHPSFLFNIKDDLLCPMLGTQPNGMRRQDLQDSYFYLEGSIYVSGIKDIKEYKSFYHAKTAPWVVQRYKSIEIDELSDFIAAEALMKAKIDGVLK